jgi:hypothetical protein
VCSSVPPDPAGDRLVALQAAWLDRALTLRGERGLEDASPLLVLLGARALQRADRSGSWQRWQTSVDAAACAAQTLVATAACGSWSPRPPHGRLERTALAALALETRWQ